MASLLASKYASDLKQIIDQRLTLLSFLNKDTNHKLFQNYCAHHQVLFQVTCSLFKCQRSQSVFDSYSFMLLLRGPFGSPWANN